MVKCPETKTKPESPVVPLISPQLPESQKLSSLWGRKTTTWKGDEAQSLLFWELSSILIDEQQTPGLLSAAVQSSGESHKSMAKNRKATVFPLHHYTTLKVEHLRLPTHREIYLFQTHKVLSSNMMVFQSQQVVPFFFLSFFFFSIVVLYMTNLKEAWRLNIIYAAHQSRLNLEGRRKPRYLTASGNRRGDISGWLIYLSIYFTINFGAKVPRKME